MNLSELVKIRNKRHGAELEWTECGGMEQRVYCADTA